MQEAQDGIDLERALSLDPDSLQNEFVQFMDTVRRAGALYAAAYKSEMIAKAKYDAVRSLAWLSCRERGQGEKKGPTIDDLNAQVTMDDGVQEARLNWIEADAERERLRGIMDALRTKRDVMLSIGRAQIVEMAGDPALKSSKAAARMESFNGEF